MSVDDDDDDDEDEDDAYILLHYSRHFVRQNEHFLFALND